MKREYHLSDAATKKLLMRILILLAASVGAVLAVLALGLKQWSREAYIGVNVMLLALAVFAAYSIVCFGGALDGKPDRKKRSQTLLVTGIAAAAALWLVLTMFGAHYAVSILIFLADLALTATLVSRMWGTVKNTWNDLTSDSDGDGNALSYPGKFVLHDVHTDDALTSPMGKVLIGNNTVLFVLVDQSSGHILVRPDGSLEARKTKLLKNETKEININVHDLLTNGELGAQRMIRIVEEECAKRGISVPEMGYSFAMFLPNFERGNDFYDEGSFRGSHWTHKMESYKKYVKRAQTADYFSGRACFSTQELGRLLQDLDAQYAAENPGKRSTSDLELVTTCISEACDLVPKA